MSPILAPYFNKTEIAHIERLAEQEGITPQKLIARITREALLDKAASRPVPAEG